MSLDYEKILKEIHDEMKEFDGIGKAADYIPELAAVDSDQFGIALCFLDGKNYSYGDSKKQFSIQSISKTITTASAFALVGDKLWERVGVEPAGTPFNSLVQLELENGIPRNPFMNAGAIVVADVLLSNLKNPYDDLIDLVQKMAGSDTIAYNPRVADSELETTYRNIALANLLKDFGNLENDVEEVIRFYVYHCSIEMTCEELAHSFQFFARKGAIPSNIPDLSTSQIKRLNALMQTCGFYDEAGQFSFKVGLPGKSGVGGGIAAVYPEFYSVAVWSPRLNAKGNSVKGMRALELLTSKSELSIF